MELPLLQLVKGRQKNFQILLREPDRAFRDVEHVFQLAAFHTPSALLMPGNGASTVRKSTSLEGHAVVHEDQEPEEFWSELKSLVKSAAMPL